MGGGHHLAQINVGRLVAPLDDPQVKDFVDNLDRINALADATPGFVWRFKGEGNNATDVQVSDDPLFIVNMSVWTDLQALGAYVYRSGHVEIMRRRREFFEVPKAPILALWWVKAGALPTIGQGLARLEVLRRKGPTPLAFTFREPFPPPGAEGVAPVLDACA